MAVAPQPACCALAKTAVRRHPDPEAEQVSELLCGELAGISERDGDWSQVTLARDGYQGWVAGNSLIPVASKASHRITQPSGLVFARPNIKSPLLQRLYFGSPVTATRVDNDFYGLHDGGFIHQRHLGELAASASCPVDIAMRFVGSPYFWGGRTCDGIDCSALVQTALQACGIDCPRDTGDQRAAFAARTIDGPASRGDLVFFPGHVGIMVDPANLLHANAFWMSTVVEPLTAVVDRLRPAIIEPILSVVRPI